MKTTNSSLLVSLMPKIGGDEVTNAVISDYDFGCVFSNTTTRRRLLRGVCREPDSIAFFVIAVGEKFRKHGN